MHFCPTSMRVLRAAQSSGRRTVWIFRFHHLFDGSAVSDTSDRSQEAPHHHARQKLCTAVISAGFETWDVSCTAWLAAHMGCTEHEERRVSVQCLWMASLGVAEGEAHCLTRAHMRCPVLQSLETICLRSSRRVAACNSVGSCLVVVRLPVEG